MSSNASAGGTAINLLQISDSHLTKDAESDLLGVVTRESLAAVLEQVRDDMAMGNCPQPDYVLATGDIAQDASIDAYHYFQAQISQFKAPSRWFPGNHDDRDILKEALNSGQETERLLRVGNWQIVLLDSSVSGKVHGVLRDEDLSFLEQCLSERPDLHTLISFHHHPVEIGSTWLDKIGLQNRDQFFEIVDRHSNVKGILWGHIHQDFSAMRGDIHLMATPSTCIQFTPKSHDFGVEAAAPGYRWLKLFDDGRIETQVSRAESYQFDLDLESNGY
jgi:Icc protein